MKLTNAHRGHARLVLAAMIASAVASIVPANALGALAPNLVSTSVSTGWTNSGSLVMASFSKTLDMSASRITVTDRDGLPVVGNSFVLPASQTNLNFTPQAPLGEHGMPYTATFTGKSLGQDPIIALTVVEQTFSIDTVLPFPPNVMLNGVDSPLTVSMTADDLTLDGVANDNIEGSGVALITVHFYNPAANPQSATPGGVPEAKRQNVLIACAPVCPISAPVSVDLSTLTPGLWTIKVSSVDAAGNRSAESQPLRVLRVAA